MTFRNGTHLYGCERIGHARLRPTSTYAKRATGSLHGRSRWERVPRVRDQGVRGSGDERESKGKVEGDDCDSQGLSN